MDTLISLWQRAVQEHPDRVAVIFEDRDYSYRELAEMVSSVAAQLLTRCRRCWRSPPSACPPTFWARSSKPPWFCTLAHNSQLTERDIKRVCMEKLASFKVPQIVEFRDALPRNASRKVVKRESV